MLKYCTLLIIVFGSILSVFAGALEHTKTTDNGEKSQSGFLKNSSDPSIPVKTLEYRSFKNPFGLSQFYEDASLLRFVNRDIPLSNKKYIPEDLVSISGAHINQAGRTIFLRKIAREELFSLAQAFEREFGEPLTVISGYRSAAYQQRMWDLGRCTSTLCAPSGYSEHQLGLAVDFFDATTEKDFDNNKRYRAYIRWLQQNAHMFGWTQSYQKGVEIDTYEVEPWHWRYVGIPMATRLHNLGWTYAEFVGFQEAIQRR